MADATEKIVPLTGSATVTANEAVEAMHRHPNLQWRLAVMKVLAEKGMPVDGDGWPDQRYIMVVSTFYAEDGVEVYEYRWRRKHSAA